MFNDESFGSSIKTLLSLMYFDMENLQLKAKFLLWSKSCFLVKSQMPLTLRCLLIENNDAEQSNIFVHCTCIHVHMCSCLVHYTCVTNSLRHVHMYSVHVYMSRNLSVHSVHVYHQYIIVQCRPSQLVVIFSCTYCIISYQQDR